MRGKIIVGIFYLLVSSSLVLWMAVKVVDLPGGASKSITLGYRDYLAQSGCEPPTEGCGDDYYWDTNSCSCQPYASPTGDCTEPVEGCGMDHYWDSGSCSCVYSASCTEPTEGCGTNYYWDSGSCSCQPYPTSSCTEPHGGCGEGYYWDSYYCSCEPTTPTSSCTEPHGGCGEGYYWDSYYCSCEPYTTPTGTCSEPTVGCGTGYYWDSYSCQCYHSGCEEPTGGCGEGSWWDSYSCSCKSDYCSPPSTGCGGNQYWDSYDCVCRTSCERPTSCGADMMWDYYDCVCRSSTSCYPPAAGCGDDYYWDSYYCSCKPYQGYTTASACSPPPAGCGDDYYWDSYSCNCKQYPSYYGCYEPYGGCGYGWHWDEGTCSCVSDYDSYAYYSSTYYSPYEYEQNFDRLAYESPERIKCIKSILTPTEFERLRFLVPMNSREHEEVHNLGNKVATCWGYPGAKADGAGPVTSPVENEKCLISAIGESAYREIYKGTREPTHEEHLKFKSCFGEVEVDRVVYATVKQSLPKVVDECVKGVLKDELYQKIKSGREEVPYDLRKKVDRCFGVDPQPFEQGRYYRAPNEVKDCLANVVGKVRFNEINSGGREPTDDERRKAEACFAQLNKDQLRFLPSPPERVPYLVSQPDRLKFREVKQDTRSVEGNVFGGKVVFSGMGPADSVVSIYVYSEPIVVTTKTDENGDWVYELNQPLEGGTHVAYATVRSEQGEDVRSSVFNFQVVAAESIDRVLLEEKQEETTSKFLTYAFLLIGVAVVVVFAVNGYMHVKKVGATSSQELGRGGLRSRREGKGEGDTRSGPVN